MTSSASARQQIPNDGWRVGFCYGLLGWRLSNGSSHWVSSGRPISLRLVTRPAHRGSWLLPSPSTAGVRATSQRFVTEQTGVSCWLASAHLAATMPLQHPRACGCVGRPPLRAGLRATSTASIKRYRTAPLRGTATGSQLVSDGGGHDLYTSAGFQRRIMPWVASERCTCRRHRIAKPQVQRLMKINRYAACMCPRACVFTIVSHWKAAVFQLCAQPSHPDF